MKRILKYFKNAIFPPKPQCSHQLEEVALEAFDQSGNLEFDESLISQSELCYYDFNEIITVKLQIISDGFCPILQIKYERFDYLKKKENNFLNLSSGITTKIYMNSFYKETWLTLCRRNIILLRPSVAFLKRLHTLQLCCNLLTFLPEEMCELPNLTRLILAKNRLTNLPENLGNLRNLRELNVAENQIAKLPKSISSLRQLNMLILTKNNLREIPGDLGGCISLKHLFVSMNNIEKISAEVMLLPFLKSIDFHDNLMIKARPIVYPKGILTAEEICARKIINEISMIPADLSEYAKEYLRGCKECFFCGGAYFKYYYEVCLVKILQNVPWVYTAKLCSLHFKTQNEYDEAIYCVGARKVGSHLCNQYYPKVSELFILSSYGPKKLKEILAYLKRKCKVDEHRNVPLFTLIKDYHKVDLQYIKYSKINTSIAYKDEFRNGEPFNV